MTVWKVREESKSNGHVWHDLGTFSNKLEAEKKYRERFNENVANKAIGVRLQLVEINGAGTFLVTQYIFGWHFCEDYSGRRQRKNDVY